jgi:hypothetical protein
VKPQPLIALCKAHVWATDFATLARKLRCTACRAKAGMVGATTEPLNGAPIGPTNQAAFDALVRRLRD